jgi:Flp pilus assembly protein TadD
MALADLNQLLTIAPYDPQATYVRGLCKLNLNDKAGACQDFRQASDYGNIRAFEAFQKHCIGN